MQPRALRFNKNGSINVDDEPSPATLVTTARENWLGFVAREANDQDLL